MSGERTRWLEFSASTAREGALTWGQWAIWGVFRQLPEGDDSLNQAGWVPVGARLTVTDVADALRRTVERHEALRSVFPRFADAPVQHVRAEGRIPFELVDCGSETVAVCAERTSGRLRRGAFDNERDLPVRAAVLTRDGVPAALVVAASHMAVDGWSFHLVLEELRQALSLATGTVSAPGPAARQPVERALFEASEEGVRRERATLRHWERTLRAAPAVMQAGTATPDDAPRDWAVIRSPALARAARELAARTGIGTGTVVLALTALVLAARTGGDTALLRLIVATRSDAQDRGFVGAQNQNGLLRVGPAEESAENFVRRCAGATLAAYRRCEGDPRKVEQLAVDVARERGFPYGGFCFFNDVRFRGADRIGAPEAERALSGADWAAELDRTTLETVDRPGRQAGAKFFLFLGELGDTCRLTLAVDPGFRELGSAERFLAALEAVAVHAAREPLGPVDALVAVAAEGSERRAGV
ncbi:condensation domain-containing protein [Streptomyces sp. KhCrAH-43]|uniref:condensation domain-containing protein n=1 Tax=Streptomyces TaxID=1883 RepID=UPI00036581A7|nr:MULTISPECIES: condensation domain-containing protein [unclassified Streptomyces]MYS38787.1 hypothetical protein [Streptomyces sp. SID4920]MYX66979.1 hypothetical protein [Streptomyces sp. SID8373]RAJ68476.1 condensation domain-containing protein [Streptomyces sp. KhCrAH-43]